MIAGLHSLPQHLRASSVERVDRDRDGRRVLTLCEGSSLAWWRESDLGWSPAVPGDDDALPFCARLPAELAAEGARVLAWKPGRRLALLALRAEGPVVIKAYRPSSFVRARDAHATAERALAGGDLQFARLRGADDALCCLEFEFVAGSLLGIDESAQQQHFRLGSGLRRMQDAALPLHLSKHDVSEELRVVASMGQRARDLGMPPPEEFDGAFGRCRDAAHRVPAAALVLCHRDLHDGQLLQSRAHIACLDFDLLCLADPALDAATFVAHLQLRALQGVTGANTIGALACARSFLEGLDRECEPGFNARMRLYQACTFLRLAAVHAMRPRWQQLAPQLSSLATRCLEDLDRA